MIAHIQPTFCFMYPNPLLLAHMLLQQTLLKAFLIHRFVSNVFVYTSTVSAAIRIPTPLFVTSGGVKRGMAIHMTFKQATVKLPSRATASTLESGWWLRPMWSWRWTLSFRSSRHHIGALISLQIWTFQTLGWVHLLIINDLILKICYVHENQCSKSIPISFL